MFTTRTTTRVGIGYDVHAITEKETFVLGGIHIPFEKEGKKMGLLAHSDGDVLTHAIIDALLGAAALGDIGDHFPDTDMTYHNIDSLELLLKAEGLIRKIGYDIVNIDATIIAQAPKLFEHKQAIKKKIAKTLKIFPDQVNIKATTNEYLGSLGKGLGIAVHAVCLIEREGK